MTEHHPIERAIDHSGGDVDAAAAERGVAREELEARRRLHWEQISRTASGTRTL